VLLDVAPLSVGVETEGGVMTVMIARNTTIPTQKKEVFSTATDDQLSVEVHVLQGEHTSARHNRTLGRLRLDGIAPAPRGGPKIEVRFDIDGAGTLSVLATDLATGQERSTTFPGSGGRQEDEGDDRKGGDDRRYAIVKALIEDEQQTPLATASGKKPAASPASAKSKRRAVEGRRPSDQGVLDDNAFCEECRAGSTAPSPGDVSAFNGIGQTFYGDAEPCARCGSVVRVRWLVFLYFPVFPLGTYRYKQIRGGEIERRFLARATHTRWNQVFTQWAWGLLVLLIGVGLFAFVVSLTGGPSRR
jgi:hypothetical protein